MLIIALGVLALMAILGAAFASLMRIERRATENYVDAKRMDLLLDSAVDRVVAQLQGAQNFMGFTDYKITPWLFMLNTEKDLAHGRTDLTDNRVGAWEVFAELAGMKYDYKTKVIDCSAQINLNGRQDTLARILDNLGRAIEQSERLKRDGKHYRNPLHEKPLGQGSQVTGLHIIQLRRRLPENRFSSKEQISQLIGPENFEILKDFITVHSWEDPDTYMPSDGLNEVPELVGTTTASGGGQAIGGGIGMQRQPSAYSAAARVDAEPHYPITSIRPRKRSSSPSCKAWRDGGSFPSPSWRAAAGASSRSIRMP